jgi:predicted outer membrane repeat protein
VVVEALTVLDLSSPTLDRPALISGEHRTRIFEVFGQIFLKNLVLEKGFWQSSRILDGEILHSGSRIGRSVYGGGGGCVYIGRRYPFLDKNGQPNVEGVSECHFTEGVYFPWCLEEKWTDENNRPFPAGTATLTGTTFRSCTATADPPKLLRPDLAGRAYASPRAQGGAISIRFGGQLEIGSDTHFVENTAASGAALAVMGHNQTVHMRGENITFQENSCTFSFTSNWDSTYTGSLARVGEERGGVLYFEYWLRPQGEILVGTQGPNKLVVTGPTTVVLIDDNRINDLSQQFIGLTRGAGLLFVDSEIEISGGAKLTVSNSDSMTAAGMYFASSRLYGSYLDVSIKILGAGSRFILENNKACIFAGMQFRVRANEGQNIFKEWPTKPAFMWIKDGAELRFRDNRADCRELMALANVLVSSDSTTVPRLKGLVGGMLMSGVGEFLVEGAGSILVAEGNWVEDQGGGVIIDDSTMNVRDGGSVQIRGNTASNAGAGLTLMNAGSVLTVSGTASSLILSDNRVVDGEGGGMTVDQGSVFLTEGASAFFSGNMVSGFGAGLSLVRRARFIAVNGHQTDDAAQQDEPGSIEFTNNVIDSSTLQQHGGGAGLAIDPSSVFRSGVPSVWRNNSAGKFDGGAILLYTKKFDKGSTKSTMAPLCQEVFMELHQLATRKACSPRVEIADRRIFSTPIHAGLNFDTKLRWQQYQDVLGKGHMDGTMPMRPPAHEIPCSEYAIAINQSTDESKCPTTCKYWTTRHKVCLPCGLTQVAFFSGDGSIFGDKSYVKFITVNADGSPGTVLASSTRLRYQTVSSVVMDLGCFEASSLDIAHARFESNRASRGGAVASVDRIGSAVQFTGSTFKDNVAHGAGGAFLLSGISAGVRFEANAFIRNTVLSGSGGAVHISGQAGLVMRHSISQNNSVRHGDGGFLFAESASSMLISSMLIRDGVTGTHGGGGGMAVTATRVALENVTFQECRSGSKGGGGLLLDGDAEAHLFHTKMIGNEAKGSSSSGGHVRLSSSKLVVHSSGSVLRWPGVEPMFPPVILGGSVVVQVVQGNGCGDTPLFEDIMTAEACKEAVALLFEFYGAVRDLAAADDNEIVIPKYCSIHHKQGNGVLTSQAYFRNTDVVDDIDNIKDMDTLESADEMKSCRGGKCTSPCTATTVCICQRKAGQNKPDDVTVFSEGHADSGVGGSIFCMASESAGPSVQFFNMSDTKLAASHCQHPAVFLPGGNTKAAPALACFGKGASFGNGVTLTASRAQSGGGIAAERCSVSLAGSKLHDNHATLESGGGLLLGTGATLSMSSGVELSGNTAKTSGGAIACVGCEQMMLLSASAEKRNIIVNNTARDRVGGAISVTSTKSATATVWSRGNLYTGNTAKMDGGAVFATAESKGGVANQAEWRSIGDMFDSNFAREGSGGALASVGVRLVLNASRCHENRAPRGGGGCLLWEPLALTGDEKHWNTLRPVFSEVDFNDNLAAFGNNVATPARSISAHGGEAPGMNFIASSETGQFRAPPQVVLRDYYDQIIVATRTPSGILNPEGDEASSINIRADLEPSTKASKRSLSGSVKEKFSFLQGKALFNNLRIINDPASGPHPASFEANVAFGEFGAGRSRVIRTLTQTSGPGAPLMWIAPCEGNTVKGRGDLSHQCESCDAKTVPNANHTRCICDGSIILSFEKPLQVGYYRSTDSSKCNGKTSCCLPCPRGADCSPCSHAFPVPESQADFSDDMNTTLRVSNNCSRFARNGLTLQELTPLPGYWRENRNAPVFQKCADAYATANADILARMRCCPLSPTSGVSVCHRKPQGGSVFNTSIVIRNNSESTDGRPNGCLEGYTGSMCSACDSERNYALVGDECLLCEGGTSFVLALVTVSLVALVIGFAFFIFLLLSSGDSRDAKASKASLYYNHLKLLIGLVQILSSFPATLVGVPWPGNFKTFAFSWSFINLDFLSLLIFPDTCTLSVTPLEQVVISMLVPPIIYLALGSAFLVSGPVEKCKRKKNGTPLSPEDAAARQHAQWESTAKTLILVTLLLYPNVSTRTFSVFRCTKIQNGLGEEETMYMLSVDMKHECWSGLHLQSVGVAITGLLVYVLGVPAVIWYLLWKNRAHLWDETSPKHKEVFFELGGLYSQYERGYPQFELVVIMMKMMMVSGVDCALTLT